MPRLQGQYFFYIIFPAANLYLPSRRKYPKMQTFETQKKISFAGTGKEHE